MLLRSVFMWVQYTCIIENNCQFSAWTIIKDKTPSEIPTGAQPRVRGYKSLIQAAGIQLMLNLQTASKLLFTTGKTGKVSEVRRSIVTALLRRAFCSQCRAGLQVSCKWLFYQHHAGDVTWWVMPLSCKAVLCLDFCLGPKLPEFNLPSRVFLKSAQIIHPWNITPVLSNVENGTRSYHTAVYFSVGWAVWGLVWDLSQSSSATFYNKFLTRRGLKIKKLHETQSPRYSHV